MEKGKGKGGSGEGRKGVGRMREKREMYIFCHELNEVIHACVFGDKAINRVLSMFVVH
jgi:hypothetical protein